MCGIVGLYAQGEANETIYNALTMLQHRGQDGAGIACVDNDTIHIRRRRGMLSEVFRSQESLERLKGNIGIGHLRYPTAGNDLATESQPFYVNSPFGIALAHNGNLTNVDELREEFSKQGKRHINSSSDSEILLNCLAASLDECGGSNEEQIFDAVHQVFKRCRGAYSAVCLIVGVGLVAFRDPNAIRPLIMGVRAGGPSGLSKEYMFASESAALTSNFFEEHRNLEAGEVIFINTHGEVFSKQCVKAAKHPCIFEYVYFSRPDSVMDEISVHKSRLRMGAYLAETIKEEIKAGDIDVVIPVPDSSRVAAVELALSLDINYREGLVKNRYIGRTFIMPRQNMRDVAVNRKLAAVNIEIKDKNILLVDDSIVRGTTCRQIINMARNAGANKVYFASAAPPVIYPNVYGIDMPSQTELVANGKTQEDVRKIIGSDGLIYQKLDNLVASVQEGNPKIKAFDTSIFDGEYITGDIDEDYLDKLDRQRRNESKSQLGFFDDYYDNYPD